MTRLLALSILALAAAPMAAEEAPMTNSLGMKLVRIEPGSFAMGSETGGDWDERPVHRVILSKPFLMAATEVTNAQYEQFDPEHRTLRGKSGFSKDDDEAVVFVSWEDATRFCAWLSKREGKPYRLPTEAEWEYACRAGTTTPFSTGEKLPLRFQKNQKQDTGTTSVPLNVGREPANPWGLCDMHGNVEEWCLDWYGPYVEGEQRDPIGYDGGDFRVTRGGSHGTDLSFLRSANRLGTLPEDRTWLIGFRVVQAGMPSTRPLPVPAAPLWARNVSRERFAWPARSDAARPFLDGPATYVKVPPGSNGPMFSKHNHQPAIAACPNGDLLAVWYSCNTEQGRELGVVAARLRRGSKEWEPAAPFWDAPDRNDHGNALLWDGDRTLYHFNGLSTDAGWGKLALVMRTSTDNGATWSKARLIDPEHRLQNQVIAGAFRTREGTLVLACDAAPGGNGGSAIHISRDGGKTWQHVSQGRPTPEFAAGATGAWIAGIHAGVTQIADGRLLAFGRGNPIEGHMPKSLSADMAENWSYSASPFPPIGGGQRLILLRLREGPLLFVSFAGGPGMDFECADGQTHKGWGMYTALSEDGGETWTHRKLLTAGGPSRKLDGGGNTREFVMDDCHAEPRGYLAATQAPDGVIHLISSALHYRLNLAWLRAPMPAPVTGLDAAPAK